jgi:glucose-6-phosphate 1-dehydrogenase
MPKTQQMNPPVLTIFGAGGDLTWRKLIPAIFNLYVEKWLPERFSIIGVDRKEVSLEEFQERLKDGVIKFSRRSEQDVNEAWDDFKNHLNHYLQADFKNAENFNKLKEILEDQDDAWDTKADRVFYLATPPGLVELITKQLGQANLTDEPDRERMVVEKPFGHDLESAKALNQMLTNVFDECQIYRIDHYLGKETVQNILAFRFANALFEPIWDRRYIDHVQITVAESVGVEHRGAYYDKAGALRDMVQNHLLQILCLIAMEAPVSFNDNEIRSKKVDVLRAIRPIPVERAQEYAVRGQYGAGWIRGNRVEAYRDEPDVADDSQRETFTAVKFFVDNWRWQDVPFYLRTGKRMPRKVSEVIIQFKPVPHQSFPNSAVVDWQPNRLLIRIQPQEGILLRFQVKQPGPNMRMSTQEMRFCYQEAFDRLPPEAYETLLLDIFQGDATLFMRADQVEAAWKIVMPILEAWESTPPVNFPNYEAGTWGPEAAEGLIAKDGRSWLSSRFSENMQWEDPSAD